MSQCMTIHVVEGARNEILKPKSLTCPTPEGWKFNASWLACRRTVGKTLGCNYVMLHAQEIHGRRHQTLILVTKASNFIHEGAGLCAYVEAGDHTRIQQEVLSEFWLRRSWVSAWGWRSTDTPCRLHKAQKIPETYL